MVSAVGNAFCLAFLPHVECKPETTANRIEVTHLAVDPAQDELQDFNGANSQRLPSTLQTLSTYLEALGDDQMARGTHRDCSTCSDFTTASIPEQIEKCLVDDCFRYSLELILPYGTMTVNSRTAERGIVSALNFVHTLTRIGWRNTTDHAPKTGGLQAFRTDKD
jgi:hypothetical protein